MDNYVEYLRYIQMQNQHSPQPITNQKHTSHQQKLYRREIQHRNQKHRAATIRSIVLTQSQLVDSNLTFHPKITNSSLQEQDFNRMVLRYKATRFYAPSQHSYHHPSTSKQKLKQIREKSLTSFKERYSRARMQSSIRESLRQNPLNYTQWHKREHSRTPTKIRKGLQYKPLLTRLLVSSKRII